MAGDEGINQGANVTGQLIRWLRGRHWLPAPTAFLIAIVLGGITYVTLTLVSEVLLTTLRGQVHEYFDPDYAFETLRWFAFCYGMAVGWTTGWGIVTFLLYPAICALLGVRLNEAWYQGLFAGILALVPLGLAVVLLGLSPGGPIFTMEAFLLGPGLATPVLQFAGVASARDAVNRRSPWRFNTQHLLIAIGGTALVLTCLRVMDWLNYDVIVWLSVWLPYQTVTLILIVWCLRSRNVLEGGGGDGGGMRG